MPNRYKYRIFLSHNRKQKKWVREFAHRLKKAEVKVFFDEDSIKRGEDIVSAIERGIKSSRYIVLIISSSSLASPWVAMETAMAIYADPNAAENRLIPVILDSVEFEQIPLTIKRLRITDLSDPEKRDKEFASLCSDLGIPKAKIPAPPPWPRSRKPRKRVVRKKRSAKKLKPKSSGTIKAEDGKEMILISGSNFKMGSSKKKEYAEDFFIDKYPVTNAEYKKFLDATKRRAPRSWDEDEYPKKKAKHPVGGISFYDAKEYANWAQKRLPTEKEWEKAARGRNGRKYPWGDKFDKNKCNTDESGTGDTTQVTRYAEGGSLYGVMDMAGNVWEWVDTWARADEKKVKGGSYKYDRDAALCSNSESYNITSGRPYDVGFRCVKDVE